MHKSRCRPFDNCSRMASDAGKLHNIQLVDLAVGGVVAAAAVVVVGHFL